MTEACTPRWSFGAALAWPCGGATLCVRERPAGEVQVGVVLPDPPAGRWSLSRDGQLVAGPEVLDPTRAAARGDDGCGRTGALVLVRDAPVPFGFHTYALAEEGGAEVSERGRAVGPGGDDPTPGLLLAGLVFVVGRALVVLGGGR